MTWLIKGGKYSRITASIHYAASSRGVVLVELDVESRVSAYDLMGKKIRVSDMPVVNLT
jgi:hypothetical protein